MRVFPPAPEENSVHSRRKLENVVMPQKLVLLTGRNGNAFTVSESLKTRRLRLKRWKSGVFVSKGSVC